MYCGIEIFFSLPIYPVISALLSSEIMYCQSPSSVICARLSCRVKAPADKHGENIIKKESMYKVSFFIKFTISQIKHWTLSIGSYKTNTEIYRLYFTIFGNFCKATNVTFCIEFTKIISTQKQSTHKRVDCSWGILGYRRNISNFNEISIGKCVPLHITLISKLQNKIT